MVMDIVYFTRNGNNEELRYSLRSLSNLSYGKVWIYGGCPRGIVPDRRVPVSQIGRTKWDKVKDMYSQACRNDDISEDFILMNDDFFIMKPTTIEPMYRCSLERHIFTIEHKYHDRPNAYTAELRKTLSLLKKQGLPTNSYELHIPFIFNREKLLYLLNKYPAYHAMRSLYGNYYQIGGQKALDVKVWRGVNKWNRSSTFLSTDDLSFRGRVGEFIKNKFPERSKYETDSTAKKNPRQ